MQQSVQPQTINIEGIRSQLAGKLAEFLFDLFGNTHIKNTFHQGFDRKQMGVDVFEIRHGLLERINGLFSGTDRRGMGLGFSRTGTMLLLEIFQHTTREGAEGLKRTYAYFQTLTPEELNKSEHKDFKNFKKT